MRKSRIKNTGKSDIRLLKSRIILVMADLIDYEKPDSKIMKNLKNILKDYSYDKAEVKKSFISSFDYFKNRRATKENATQKDINRVKKIINSAAKTVWKKKK